MVVARDWGKRKGSWWLMGAEFEFCKMRRVLEMGDDDGYTTM